MMEDATQFLIPWGHLRPPFIQDLIWGLLGRGLRLTPGGREDSSALCSLS